MIWKICIVHSLLLDNSIKEVEIDWHMDDEWACHW